MADMTRFITFTVDQKYEGAYFWKKFGMIALYVVFFIGGVTLMTMWMKGIGVLIGVILFAVLLFKVLKPLTWKYVKTEHRYTMQHGSWELYLDHMGPSLNSYYRRKIKEATAIVPMTEENLKQYVEGKTFKNEYDLRGSTKAEDAYIAIFPEEDGTETLIKFVATNDALSIMAYYNKEATIVQKVYH